MLIVWEERCWALGTPPTKYAKYLTIYRPVLPKEEFSHSKGLYLQLRHSVASASKHAWADLPWTMQCPSGRPDSVPGIFPLSDTLQ